METDKTTISFTVNSPAKPLEAFIYIFISGFFFYFSPEKINHTIDFLSIIGVYVASLLGLYFFQQYNNKSIKIIKVLFLVLFFLSTLFIAFFFFQAFFSFLNLFIEFFYLDKLVVTSGYLTAVSLILLAWALIKRDKLKRQNELV